MDDAAREKSVQNTGQKKVYVITPQQLQNLGLSHLLPKLRNHSLQQKTNTQDESARLPAKKTNTNTSQAHGIKIPSHVTRSNISLVSDSTLVKEDTCSSNKQQIVSLPFQLTDFSNTKKPVSKATLNADLLEQTAVPESKQGFNKCRKQHIKNKGSVVTDTKLQTDTEKHLEKTSDGDRLSNGNGKLCDNINVLSNQSVMFTREQIFHLAKKDCSSQSDAQPVKSFVFDPVKNQLLTPEGVQLHNDLDISKKSYNASSDDSKLTHQVDSSVEVDTTVKKHKTAKWANTPVNEQDTHMYDMIEREFQTKEKQELMNINNKNDSLAHLPRTHLQKFVRGWKEPKQKLKIYTNKAFSLHYIDDNVDGSDMLACKNKQVATRSLLEQNNALHKGDENAKKLSPCSKGVEQIAKGSTRNACTKDKKIMKLKNTTGTLQMPTYFNENEQSTSDLSTMGDVRHTNVTLGLPNLVENNDHEPYARISLNNVSISNLAKHNQTNEENNSSLEGRSKSSAMSKALPRVRRVGRPRKVPQTKEDQAGNTSSGENSYMLTTGDEIQPIKQVEEETLSELPTGISRRGRKRKCVNYFAMANPNHETNSSEHQISKRAKRSHSLKQKRELSPHTDPEIKIVQPISNLNKNNIIPLQHEAKEEACASIHDISLSDETCSREVEQRQESFVNGNIASNIVLKSMNKESFQQNNECHKTPLNNLKEELGHDAAISSADKGNAEDGNILLNSSTNVTNGLQEPLLKITNTQTFSDGIMKVNVDVNRMLETTSIEDMKLNAQHQLPVEDSTDGSNTEKAEAVELKLNAKHQLPVEHNTDDGSNTEKVDTVEVETSYKAVVEHLKETKKTSTEVDTSSGQNRKIRVEHLKICEGITPNDKMSLRGCENPGNSVVISKKQHDMKTVKFKEDTVQLIMACTRNPAATEISDEKTQVLTEQAKTINEMKSEVNVKRQLTKQSNEHQVGLIHRELEVTVTTEEGPPGYSLRVTPSNCKATNICAEISNIKTDEIVSKNQSAMKKKRGRPPKACKNERIYLDREENKGPLKKKRGRPATINRHEREHTNRKVLACDGEKKRGRKPHKGTKAGSRDRNHGDRPSGCVISTPESSKHASNNDDNHCDQPYGNVTSTPDSSIHDISESNNDEDTKCDIHTDLDVMPQEIDVQITTSSCSNLSNIPKKKVGRKRRNLISKSSEDKETSGYKVLDSDNPEDEQADPTFNAIDSDSSEMEEVDPTFTIKDVEMNTPPKKKRNGNTVELMKMYFLTSNLADAVLFSESTTSIEKTSEPVDNINGTSSDNLVHSEVGPNVQAVDDHKDVQFVGTAKQKCLRKSNLRRTKFVTSGSDYTCAVCNERMPKLQWTPHNLRIHNNLAWRVGEKPLDLTDQRLVMIILNRVYKLCKRFFCNKCKTVVKSALGFLSHIAICGKTEEEIEAMKVVCPRCPKRMMPVAIPAHIQNTHAVKKKIIKSEDKEEQYEGLGKRSAAKKAINHIKTIEVRSDESDEEGVLCKICLHVCNKTSQMVHHIQNVHNILPEPSKADGEYRCDQYASKDKDKRYEILKKGVPFLQNGRSRSTNILFKNGFKWTLRLYEKYLCFKKLFDGFSRFEWELLSADALEEYLPHMSESCEVSRFVYKKQYGDPFSCSHKFKKYDLFESEVYADGNCMVFCGGPVSAMAWLPTPVNVPSDQILAISTVRHPDYVHSPNDNCQMPCIVQFWNFGKVQTGEKYKHKPSLAFGLAFDFGPIWHMEWCPSGCYHADDDGKPLRLGLLAVAGSDAGVYIYNVPAYNDDELIFYKAIPVKKLCLAKFDDCPSSESFFASKLSWGKNRGHNYIAVGYSNGMCALFDLGTVSSILANKDGDGVNILHPYLSFQAHMQEISGLHLHHFGDPPEWLMTSSKDKSLNIWDLRNVSVFIASSRRAPITNGIWLSNFLTQIVAYDEGAAKGYVGSSQRCVRDVYGDSGTVLPSCSTVSCLASSDWLSCIMEGDRVGSILALFALNYLSLFDDKFIRPRRMLMGYTVLIDKKLSPDKQAEAHKVKQASLKRDFRKPVNLTKNQCETEDNESCLQDESEFIKLENSTSSVTKICPTEPFYYHEAQEKYGLVFCDGATHNYNDFYQQNRQVCRDWSKILQSSSPNLYPLQCVNKLAINPNHQAASYYAAGYQVGFVKLNSLDFVNNEIQILNELFKTHVERL